MCLDRYRVIALKTLVTRARSYIYFMPKYFADIIGKFGHRQRVFVLVVLLVFSSGTYLLGTHLKQDDCSDLRKENIDLHRDFIAISAMIRDLRAHMTASQEEVVIDEPVSVEEAEVDSIVVEPIVDTIWVDTTVTFNFDHVDQQMLDNILRISESHGSGLMYDGLH